MSDAQMDVELRVVLAWWLMPLLRALGVLVRVIPSSLVPGVFRVAAFVVHHGVSISKD